MDLLKSFEFSQTSLIFFNLIPFLYFILHGRFWYKADALKKIDAMLFTAVVILGAAVIFKTYSPGIARNKDMMKWALLHILPLAVTIVTVFWGQKGGVRFGAAAGGGGGATAKKVGEGGSYAPVPLNKGIEKMSWDDLVIDENLKAELKSVVTLLKDPKTAKNYGIEVPKGILLNGPPGTGKTTIAKVIATNANLSFFVLQTDEIVSKWVGESEKNLTKLFEAASRHSPSVIFIDEVDSIGKSRGGGAAHSENLLNHLLQLVDGVVKKEGLYIIAATNRAELVDAALKRSGRLNKTIEVPLPDEEARKRLFKLYLSKLTLEGDVNLDILAELTPGKSAADIKEVCNQAGLNAFRRESGSKKRDFIVTYHDIELALHEFMQQKK